VTTLAGSGLAAFADGVGTVASFYHPDGISVRDSTGVVYVAEHDNHRIRSIAPGAAFALQLMKVTHEMGMP
jgi:DNA-binding beta-propeller fold protein YncE